MKPTSAIKRGVGDSNYNSSYEAGALPRHLNPLKDLKNCHAVNSRGDYGGNDALCLSTPASHNSGGENNGGPDLPLFPPAACVLSRRWCHVWLYTACAAVSKSCTDAFAHYRPKPPPYEPTQGRKRGGHLRFVSSRCSSFFLVVQAGCLYVLHCVGVESFSSSAGAKPHICSTHTCRYCRRIVYYLIGLLLVLALAALLLMKWMYERVMMDPDINMRICLRVVYHKREVAKLLSALSPPTAAPSTTPLSLEQPGGFYEDAYKVAKFVYAYLEDCMMTFLIAAFKASHKNATRMAQELMAAQLKKLNIPEMPMLGERSIMRNTVMHSGQVSTLNATDGTTVGQRMLQDTRSAVLRCTYGVPTLPKPGRVLSADLSDIEAALDSLWTSFAEKDVMKLVQPQCLARSQCRMPCADVGLRADSQVVTAAGAAPADESSRVQHMYEHRRLRVGSDVLTELFYNYTPGLPAEARIWRMSATQAEDKQTNMSLIKRRVRAQGERFCRSTAKVAEGAARAASGVILFLSGAADRNPKARNNDFTQHALPLLEANLLRAYPHYPVHVFYEASMPSPAWSLTDALRYSDVYTIRHSWQPTNAKQQGSGNPRIHIPPPPPIIVNSVEQLSAMRAQQASAQSWFQTVASRVPSAPYVTFENVAPLFSTLPCGVTEEDVSVWVDDRRVYPTHRRGYRQMCRFWARLVWRLPSLRIWTDSTEGRSEMAAYADPEQPPLERTAHLPPWRYRYTYYLRLDTDSYLHRPVACDPFVTMMEQRCAYGYNSLVLDLKTTTMNFGTAIAEWIDNRTSIRDGERALEGGNWTPETDVMGEWGRLSDPSLSSFVTLVPAVAEVELPLPPTWPWSNVYPEHSSAALSPSEKDVLRSLFFTDLFARWQANKRSPELYKNLAAVNDEMLSDRLPLHYAQGASYNRLMYYNNFELGTFALKNHPLYTSVAEFFDNRDYDDETGLEREAAAVNYTLAPLSAGAVDQGSASVYAAPVYLLKSTSSGAAFGGGGGAAAARASGQCLGRRVHGRAGADPDQNSAAHKIKRDWRSGYLQYRWGDAPVHTFGVETVMQREGWGVCAFTENFGLYEHGRFTER
ncbi:glycosyltransferase family 15 [Lotmaria passim]